jgi:hypothetical protein
MIKTFLTDENHENPDDKNDGEPIVSPKRRGTILDGSASPSPHSPHGRSNKRKHSQHIGHKSGNSIDYENS